MKKKNIGMLVVITVIILVVFISGTYAYYQAIFKDERTENNTNLNTEFLSSNVEVKNISGVPGSFSGFVQVIGKSLEWK